MCTGTSQLSIARLERQGPHSTRVIIGGGSTEAVTGWCISQGGYWISVICTAHLLSFARRSNSTSDKLPSFRALYNWKKDDKHCIRVSIKFHSLHACLLTIRLSDRLPMPGTYGYIGISVPSDEPKTSLHSLCSSLINFPFLLALFLLPLFFTCFSLVFCLYLDPEPFVETHFSRVSS